MGHHTQPQRIEYKILHYQDARKHKGWKYFCDVNQGYELTAEREYKIKREIENDKGLFLSTVKIRMTRAQSC